MSTGEEFDSWEDIKRIDREWKQSWYEFGYQTLKNQIDSLSEENRKIEDTRQSHMRRIFELQNSVRELQDEIHLGWQTLTQNLNKINYLCCEMARKNEEEFLISDPKSGQNGEPDKYGYISVLLVTHETGSWEAWKAKLSDDSEILKKMSKK